MPEFLVIVSHSVNSLCHIRQSLETDVDRRIVQRYLSRKEMLVAWGRKLERSPFLVDQVAESERIDEEHRVKLLEEARRMQRFDARKKVIKKEIILRVLAESNAIETLRSEKRCDIVNLFQDFDSPSILCFLSHPTHPILFSVFDLPPLHLSYKDCLQIDSS